MDEHTLTVEFDDRIESGALSLPGLPRWQGGGGAPYAVVAWREVGTEDAP